MANGCNTSTMLALRPIEVTFFPPLVNFSPETLSQVVDFQ